MDFAQMQTELGYIIKDSRLAPLLAGWINAAILEVATDYDLPPLALADPYTLSVDTSKWLWPLPDTFHKKVFMAKWVGTDGAKHRIHHIHKDPTYIKGLNHTLTADHVSRIGVIPQGKDLYLGIHPLAVQELELWFYRKPTVLEGSSDECDCIPFNFIPQVIYPKLIIKNYEFITDQVVDFPLSQGSIQYWMGKLAVGLNGGRGQGTGLLGFYNINYHPPRMHGGRNALGGRPYNYGSF